MTSTVREIAEVKIDSRLEAVLNRISESIEGASKEQKQALLSILEDWQHGHKRSHPRKSCSVPVDYAADGRAFRGSIKNVSVNGLFIETRQKFDPGEKITLTFSLPNQSKPLKTQGKVIWNNAEGVGVQFNLPNKYLEEFWKARIEAL